MHIGLIAGIGPAATVFYYERLVQKFAAADAPLALTMGHTSALTLSRNVADGNQHAQAKEFARITQQLERAGAEAVVISSMGGHFCADAFVPISPLPLIDGPSAVAKYLRRAGITRIGILGTRVVMQTALYGALDGITAVVPQGHDLATVNDDYIAVAIAGAAEPQQRERLLTAGERLVREQGAEAVLLGGTDLNVVYAGAAVTFNVIDSAEIHVDAIADAALEVQPPGA